MTVTLKGKKLKQGTDYTVKYKNNKKAALQQYWSVEKVRILEQSTKTFKILPKKHLLRKVSA